MKWTNDPWTVGEGGGGGEGGRGVGGTEINVSWNFHA